MGDLMQFLRELMKDYKNEIQEVLAADRQLMAEIEFDLKRFEQQELSEATRQTPRVAPAPPTAMEAVNTEPEIPLRKPSLKTVVDEHPSSSSSNEIDKQTSASDIVTGADIASEPLPAPADEDIATDKHSESSVANEPDLIAPVAEPEPIDPTAEAIDDPSTSRRKKRGKVLQQLDPPALPTIAAEPDLSAPVPEPDAVAPTAEAIDDPSTGRRKKRGNVLQHLDPPTFPNVAAEPMDDPSTGRGKKRGKVLQQLDPPVLPSTAPEPDLIAPTAEPTDDPSISRRKKRGKVLLQLDPPALPIMINPGPEFIAPAAAVMDDPANRRRRTRRVKLLESAALPNVTVPLPSNQPRIMSTPIKANAELTFHINDAEMSIIPHADTKASKRRRL